MVREQDPLNRPAGSEAARRPATEPAAGRMAEYHAAHSSREARQQVEQTRSRMSDTLNVLEEKLAPRRLLDQVIDMFRSTGGESKVIETIRQNPIPTILIAAGATWLVVESMREQDDTYVRRPSRGKPVRGSLRESAGRMYQSVKQSVSGAAESAREKVSETTESMRQSGSETTESVGDRAPETGESLGQRMSERAGSIRERVSRGAGGVREKVSGTMSSLGEKASDMSHAAREKAQSWMGGTRERMGEMRGRAREMASKSGETFRNTYDDYPLATAAGVLAAGVLVGLILPSTRRERRWIGPTRDRALDSAKESGRRMGEQAVGTVTEKVTAVATAAADAATEKFREQRKSGESIVDKAKEMYTEGRDAAQEKMRQEGISREGILEGIEDKAGGPWERKPGPREPFGSQPEPDNLGGGRPSGAVDQPIGGVAPEAIAEAPEEPLDANDLPTDIPSGRPEDRTGPTPSVDRPGQRTSGSPTEGTPADAMGGFTTSPEAGRSPGLEPEDTTSQQAPEEASSQHQPEKSQQQARRQEPFGKSPEGKQGKSDKDKRK